MFGLDFVNIGLPRWCGRTELLNLRMVSFPPLKEGLDPNTRPTLYVPRGNQSSLEKGIV